MIKNIFIPDERKQMPDFCWKQGTNGFKDKTDKISKGYFVRNNV